MEARIKEFLDDLREEFEESQKATGRLLNVANYEDDKEEQRALLLSLATRANAMSDVLIALNNNELISDDEDEEQAELFGLNVWK